jgi:hypothetical protein
MSSRTVVVCVEPGQPVSRWCRAEYEPALQVEVKSGIKRVVVALLGGNCAIPKELETCPSFRVGPETSQLSQFLQEANRMSPAQTLEKFES